LNNEDGHYVDGQGRVFVVADGIGGASAGERASQMVVDLLPRHISYVVSGIEPSEDEVSAAIRAAFAETNAAILRAARQNIEFQPASSCS
jgi:protein phosphatase